MGYTREDIIVGLAYVVTVVITYGSQAGVFGATNKDISDQHPTPATPAAYAFGIWGIIFTGELVALVYLLLRNDADMVDSKKAIVRSVGMMWAAGWIFEAAWQFAFVKNNKVSLVISSALLILALLSFVAALRRSYDVIGVPTWAKMLIMGVTSINAAWLSVASIIGILIAVGITVHVATVPLAIVCTILAVAFGVHVSLVRLDPFYCATLAWALLAVFMKQRGMYNSVAWTALAGALACVTAAALACVPKSDASRAAQDAEANVRQRLVDEL